MSVSLFRKGRQSSVKNPKYVVQIGSDFTEVVSSATRVKQMIAEELRYTPAAKIKVFSLVAVMNMTPFLPKPKAVPSAKVR